MVARNRFITKREEELLVGIRDDPFGFGNNPGEVEDLVRKGLVIDNTKRPGYEDEEVPYDLTGAGKLYVEGIFK